MSTYHSHLYARNNFLWREFERERQAREAERELAARLIRVGSRVLANGSSDRDDAMRRQVRKHLRDCALLPEDPKQKAKREFALELIDAGYKALAVKLHPDRKGGSPHEMARLNQMRDRLRSHAWRL
jgi:hypothetical protein